MKAQITIPDVVYFGVGILVLAAMARPIYRLLAENSGSFSTGTVMLWQMMIPALVMTLVVVLFAIASGG